MAELAISAGKVYSRSIVQTDGSTYFLVRKGAKDEWRLAVRGDPRGFEYTETEGENFALCPLSTENAALLRERLPALRPSALGTRRSFGFGDRIGNATPGHIQALEASGAEELIAPVFAQQSVRENSRTKRTPQQVLDDATWGVFQMGWKQPWGADADRMKGVPDLKPFLDAGYSYFTIDPSVHVDEREKDLYPDELEAKVKELPWSELGSSYADMRERYLQDGFALEGFRLSYDEAELQRVLLMYAPALLHSRSIIEAIQEARESQAFDLEIAIDQTKSATSVHEHFFLASEFQRLGLPVNNLGLHYPGNFQRGGEFLGDLNEFEQEFKRHAAIMRHFGGYKLCVHTGSDKYSLYPIIAQHAAGMVHIKTSGTSYLEALRVIAAREPKLFRSILELARAHFDRERKAYAAEARITNVPGSNALKDRQLPGLLDQFDSRQVLHISFGMIMESFSQEILACLDKRDEAYWSALEGHFKKHMQPFLG